MFTCNHTSSQGYYGTAIGKAKQAAKTEIEKLKLDEMTAREAVKQVARMYESNLLFPEGGMLTNDYLLACSIHSVHDDVKDRDFELEMSWIGPETKYQHQLVPKELALEAENYAKVNNRSYRRTQISGIV